MESIWSELKKAGAILTRKVKIALFERFANALKSLAMRQGQSRDTKLFTYGKLVAKARMWCNAPGEDDDMLDIIEPSLPSVGVDDKLLSKMFCAAVFGWLAKLVSLGDEGVSDFLSHLQVAGSKMELPDDAEIGDACAKTLNEAQDFVALGPLIGSDSINIHTDTAAYDNIRRLDKSACVADGPPSPMGIMGIAMANNPFWKQRLDRVVKHIETLKLEAPKIKLRHREVRAIGKSVGVKAVKDMETITEEIKYWEAAVPTINLCFDLKADLVAQAESNTKQLLLKDDGINYSLEMKPNARALMINAYQKLYKALAGICKSDKKIRDTQIALNGAVCTMDLSIKMQMLLTSAKEWSMQGDEPTQRLKDALAPCSGKPLPDDCAEALRSLWHSVYTTLCKSQGAAFLLEPNCNKFGVLTAVAENMPDNEKEKCVVVAEWIHAAWRVKSLAVDLTKLGLPAVAETPEGSLENKEKSNRELLRAVQRLEVAHPRAIKVDLSKTENVGEKVDEVMTRARALISTVGVEFQLEVQKDINLAIEVVQKEFDADAKQKEFAGKLAKSTDINEIKTYFLEGFDQSKVTELLAPCVAIEQQIKALSSKVLEFGLFIPSEFHQDADLIIKSVRASACIHAIMCVLTSKTIDGDKVEMRKKMREVQSDLKAFELKPAEIGNSAVLEAYNAVLKMRNVT